MVGGRRKTDLEKGGREGEEEEIGRERKGIIPNSEEGMIEVRMMDRRKGEKKDKWGNKKGEERDSSNKEWQGRKPR